MPRIAAGQDFLASVDELFQELRRGGHTSESCFTFVTEQLVAQLAAVPGTAAAEGEEILPNSSLRLPDGDEIQTKIRSPPASLKIDAPFLQQLSEASDATAFMELLSGALERNRMRGPSRKRKTSGQLTGATPRKRIILKNWGPTPRIERGEEPETPVSRPHAPIDLEAETVVRLPLPSPPNTNAVVRMDIRKDDKAVMSPSAFMRRATRVVVPRTELEIIGDEDDVCEVPGPSTIIDVSSDEDEDSSTAKDCEHERGRGNGGRTIVDLDSDLEMQDAAGDEVRTALSIETPQKKRSPLPYLAAGDPKPGCTAEEVQSAETLKQIIDEVCGTTAENWESYRPRLLEALLPYAEMEYAKLSSLGPTVARDALTRLDAAVARLGDDISVIEPAEWDKYKGKLRKLCGSRAFPTYNFQQRLWKVMDVMYLDEESGAMESGDWDRLETVAKIIATICEAMGPVGEGAEEISQRWFCSKVQDIRFLKKIVMSIDRKTKVLRVRDYGEDREDEHRDVEEDDDGEDGGDEEGFDIAVEEDYDQEVNADYREENLDDFEECWGR